jgi:hypothetical protein
MPAAKDFQLSLSKVRILCKYMGGGFGNKNQARMMITWRPPWEGFAANQASWNLPAKTTTLTCMADGHRSRNRLRRKFATPAAGRQHLPAAVLLVFAIVELHLFTHRWHASPNPTILEFRSPMGG